MRTIKCDRCGRTFQCPDETIQVHCPDCGTILRVIRSITLRIGVNPTLVMSNQRAQTLLKEIIKYAETRIQLYGGKRKVTYIG